MKTKTSADYQRDFRKRLRAKGLVKKEVWIVPEHAKRLSAVEKQLRISSDEKISDAELSLASDAKEIWTSNSLFSSLAKEALFSSEKATLEIIEGIAPSLYITLHEYGDLAVFLNVTGEQIIVESVLWPVADVIDKAGFNDAVLRTHKYFPLSTISLEQGVDGQDYYMMFGALSSYSLLANVIFELEVLASNVIQAAAAYAEFIHVPAEVEQ
ncbi:MAG: YjfI family protein [Pseudomonadales bacterium]|nr:YjfI family protein [Pseudomonadales bacterium]